MKNSTPLLPLADRRGGQAKRWPGWLKVFLLKENHSNHPQIPNKSAHLSMVQNIYDKFFIDNQSITEVS
jgi:hypothetical protein